MDYWPPIERPGCLTRATELIITLMVISILLIVLLRWIVGV